MCDRRVVIIKLYMKIFFNLGNNIESVEEMKNVIFLLGGVLFVNVIVLGLFEVFIFFIVWLEGVSIIFNIEYFEEGLCVWKVYKIGFGKLI